MIKLRIKNKNGDVLYERDDEYYVRLNSEDFAYISDALDDIGSDIVYVDIDCDVDDNPFMVCSYHSVMRGGKTVIENKIKKVLKEYERQLSALPARHPAAHMASRMREVGSHDEDDGHDVATTRMTATMRTMVTTRTTITTITTITTTTTTASSHCLAWASLTTSLKRN